ncbi:MAG: LamG-like jellyroll fold domain-containing protein [Limisphaerales bacterium]
MPALLPLLSGSAHGQAIQLVTVPGDPITASSTNSPSAENVANSIDGTTAKYLNFDGATGPCGFIVQPSVGATIAQGLAQETANDSPNRDPEIVTLEGSNDPEAINSWDASTNWTMISSNYYPGVTNRYYWTSNFFANFTPYTTYRWTVVACQGTGQNSMQVGEVAILGRTAPANVVIPTDKITASSTNSPSAENVANSIDGTTAKYLNFDGATGPCGFIVQPAVGATVIEGLSQETANDSPNRDPQIVTLEGSNDPDAINSWDASTNWTMISSNYYAGVTNRYYWEYSWFENETPYTTYRWTTVACQGTGQNSMQVAEIQFLGQSAPAVVTVPTDKITASSTNSPSAENVANSIDGTTAKYLNFDGATGPCGFIVQPSVGATTVTGLAQETANDSPNRDPEIVTLEGSNDPDAINSWDASTNWTMISSNYYGGVTNRYYWEYSYFFNQQAFTTYRWTTVACQGTGQNSMQVAEVQLLAVTSKANCAIASFTSTPVNTPVLPGSTAEFLCSVNGPWPLQWYTNGVAIPGATKAAYTTDPVTTANAGIAYSVGIVGCQASPPVYAQLFTPSDIQSIGIQFMGNGSPQSSPGANGSGVPMNSNDIAGVQLQAFWNPCTNTTGSGSSGDDVTFTGGELTDSSNNPTTITFNFANTGGWGAGVNTETPTERLLNGIAGSETVNNPTPMTFIFGNVPTNSTNAVIVYSVGPPAEVEEESFQIQTNPAIIYEETFSSPTYNTAPGYYRATSTNSGSPTPGDFVRFDGVVPDENSNITLTVNLVSIEAGVKNNVGVNAVQLLVNAPNPGAPPQIVEQPQPAVALSNGVLTISVNATGSGLSYQWRYNGVALFNGGAYSGASTATLTVNPFTAAQAGQYSVAIFNAAGSVISDVATATLSDFKITNGLVAEWLFNQTNGTTVSNAVAGGQPAYLSGTVAWGKGESAPDALVLDGSTTWGFVSNYTTASNAISGATWVNVDTSTNAYTVGDNITLFRSEDGNFLPTGGLVGQFSLELVSDTNATVGLIPTAVVGLSTLNGYVSNSAPQALEITTNGWHHIAFTADGAQLRLYLDGQEVGYQDYTGDVGGQGLYALAQEWISIGVRATSDTNTVPYPVDIDTTTGPDWLPGSLDDMALWTRALTATEIQDIYQAGLMGMPVSSVVETLPTTLPKLTASVVGKNIVISWAPTGGTLQSSPTLGASAVWTAVGTANPATVAIGTGSSFFRVLNP